MKILGTGLTGLVGSRITEVLSHKYEFFEIGRSQGIDITDIESFKKVEEKDASIILHLAAKADVDGCERDRGMGEEGEAWRINVLGTQNVVNFASSINAQVIYISTDFVFDGEKPIHEGYKEEDLPNPINWYGTTKREGEKIVEESGLRYLILRIAYLYSPKEGKKLDFVHAIVNKLKLGETVNAVQDHYMCPTYVDDVAFAIDNLITTNSKGIFHAVGSAPISPYQASLEIASHFSLDQKLVMPTTRSEFFANRAPRPFNLYLKDDKINGLGVKMRSLQEGLKALGEK